MNIMRPFVCLFETIVKLDTSITNKGFKTIVKLDTSITNKGFKVYASAV